MNDGILVVEETLINVPVEVVTTKLLLIPPPPPRNHVSAQQWRQTQNTSVGAPRTLDHWGGGGGRREYRV